MTNISQSWFPIHASFLIDNEAQCCPIQLFQRLYFQIFTRLSQTECIVLFAKITIEAVLESREEHCSDIYSIHYVVIWHVTFVY